MKKLIALLIAITMTACMLSACGEKGPANRLEQIVKNKKIVMATSPDFAPIEFIDYTKTGAEQYVGCEIELGKFIARELGVELEIKAMDFGAIQAAVTTGQVDMALSGFAWKEDRAENMGLSDFYNFESEDNGQGIIIPKDQADVLNTADSFAGKTIAVQANSLQLELCQKQLPEGVTLQPISNLSDGIMMLLTNKVDALASASGTGDILIKGKEDQLQFSDFFFEYESEGNVLAVNKNEPELLAKLNEILAKAKAEKLLPQWYTDAKALADTLGIE